jgi:hypothetical protein
MIAVAALIAARPVLKPRRVVIGLFQAGDNLGRRKLAEDREWRMASERHSEAGFRLLTKPFCGCRERTLDHLALDAAQERALPTARQQTTLRHRFGIDMKRDQATIAKERGAKMYASSLMFHTLPGKTGELENELQSLLQLVQNVGGQNARILHTHFASPEAPNVVFVQDAPDLETLEKQIHQVTEDAAFQQWTKKVSPLLRQSPNREIYLVVADGAAQWTK